MVRAGGAGIPAFFTATGVGTDVEEGKIVIKYNGNGKPEILSKKKESREFNGRKYIMEDAIKGDFALIKGWKADQFGNVVFKGTAKNFNPVMGRAATRTIVEVEEIVAAGAILPEHIDLPGIYVDSIVLGDKFEKRIERLTLSDDASFESDPVRLKIARRAALEFSDGMYGTLSL